MKATIFEDLDKPLNAALVERRKVGGRSEPAPYLEGYNAINQANRLFGFDGWSSDVLAVETHTTRRVDTTSGEVTEAVLLYRATVRVTVPAWGVSKTDIGIGVPAGGTGDAHDMAVKAAVTDGLKRALRQFGPQFGNDLYDRDADTATQKPAQSQEQPKQGQGQQPIAYVTEDQIGEMRRHRDRLGWDGPTLIRWVKSRSEGKGPRDLSYEEAASALNALAVIPTPGKVPAGV